MGARASIDRQPVCYRHVKVDLGSGLTVGRVEEMEHKIGAGLIEEVVRVAENELKLVDQMLQAKP